MKAVVSALALVVILGALVGCDEKPEPAAVEKPQVSEPPKKEAKGPNPVVYGKPLSEWIERLYDADKNVRGRAINAIAKAPVGEIARANEALKMVADDPKESVENVSASACLLVCRFNAEGISKRAILALLLCGRAGDEDAVSALRNLPKEQLEQVAGIGVDMLYTASETLDWGDRNSNVVKTEELLNQMPIEIIPFLKQERAAILKRVEAGSDSRLSFIATILERVPEKIPKVDEVYKKLEAARKTATDLKNSENF